MAESFGLSPLSRGTLPEEAVRLARLAEARPQILAVVAGESDLIAIMASLACTLYTTLSHTNFCGFYRRVGECELVIGPYQGSLGCLRISFDRGVCGQAARTRTIQRVPNVEEFPGHIACDPHSRSELVIPIVKDGDLLGVLDLDSPFVDAFSVAEASALAALMHECFASAIVSLDPKPSSLT